MDKVTEDLEDIDSSKRFTQTSEPSHVEGDPVATLASCNFAKANKRNYPPRDKQPQTLSPISKSSRPPRISKCHIEPEAFKMLPQSEKDKIIKQNRKIDTINEANGYHTNVYRPRRGDCRAKGQRPADRSKTEADLTEMQSQGQLQCLVNEVDEEEISKLRSDEASGSDPEPTNKEPVEPKVLFTTEAKPAEKTDPTTESSPNGPMPPDSGPSASDLVNWRTC